MRATPERRHAAPRIWLLLADKGGDNAQAETLAAALPWQIERKQLRFDEAWAVRKPRVRPSLEHLDLERSDPLEPPWPDLVLTIGRRPSLAALWIRERSGGRTKIVIVGKPSGRMQDFDLVIASSEVVLPPLPIGLSIALPLLRVDSRALAAASEAWRTRLAGLPRPLVAILVGGPTVPFVYDESLIDELLKIAQRVRERGGTPFLTTSRRTPEPIVERVASRLPDGARLYRWTPDAPDNPYLGLLGLADEFVVTGDSISMLVEVARLGRPLAILRLPTGPLGALDEQRRSWTRWLFAAPHQGLVGWLRRSLASAALRAGVLGSTRDFGTLHHLLVERGLARWADEAPRPPQGDVPDDLGAAVARVCALLEPPPA